MASPPSAPARLLLAGLGAGWLRPGPGTWASATVAASALLAEHLAGLGREAACAFLGVGTLVTLAWGGRATSPDGRHDPGWVVSDEWAGQGLAWLIAAPGLDPVLASATFGLFRLLDIVKPEPIGRLQRIPGGAGVLADDLAAGLLAGLLAWLLAWLLGSGGLRLLA